jgi:hypothetical protein
VDVDKIKSLDGREPRSNLSSNDSRGVSTDEDEDDELDLLKNIRLHHLTDSAQRGFVLTQMRVTAQELGRIKLERQKYEEEARELKLQQLRFNEKRLKLEKERESRIMTRE